MSRTEIDIGAYLILRKGYGALIHDTVDGDLQGWNMKMRLIKKRRRTCDLNLGERIFLDIAIVSSLICLCAVQVARTVDCVYVSLAPGNIGLEKFR